MNLQALIMGGIVVLFVGIVAGTTLYFVRRTMFLRFLRAAIEDRSVMVRFRRSHPASALLPLSSRMEMCAKRWGALVVTETGIAPLWAARLVSSRRRSDLRRVLNYCPDSYTFTAFMVSGRNPGLDAEFARWVKEAGGKKVLESLVRSYRGEELDGRRVIRYLADSMDEVRRMAGDPEWRRRLFAYRVMLDDLEPSSRERLWSGFNDPHPEIRRCTAEHYKADDATRLCGELWRLTVDDPTYQVRSCSKARILLEYREFYQPDYDALNSNQTFHLLELLREDVGEDRSAALQFLSGDNVEFRYPAALFLDRCGVLGDMLNQALMEDAEGLERCHAILRNASEVGVTQFLTNLSNSSSLGTLYLAGSLLKKYGYTGSITLLGEVVFGHTRTLDVLCDFDRQLYATTIDAIVERGEVSALRLLRAELDLHCSKESFLLELIPRIPSRMGELFIPQLRKLLEAPTLPLRSLLEERMASLPSGITLPVILSLLAQPAVKESWKVRLSLLKLLAGMRGSFLLQRLLEELPSLPDAGLDALAKVLNERQDRGFKKIVTCLFDSVDAPLRASLLQLLAVMKSSTFRGELYRSLEDTAPEVRCAGVCAFAAIGEPEKIDKIFAMLRDPSEMVRLSAAAVLGESSDREIYAKLAEVLSDPDETTLMKREILRGLGNATSTSSIPLMIDSMETDRELREYVVQFLALKRDEDSLQVVIKHFKEGTPSIRRALSGVFVILGEDGKTPLLKLLKGGDRHLKPIIAEILEETGYINEIIRDLSHRDIERRREAVIELLDIGSRAAYKGVMLAARDPNREIRALVAKALGKLTTRDGDEILEALKSDPDLRVRRYTSWALDRLSTVEKE